VGYQRGNGSGYEYGEKAWTDGFVEANKERGLGFPVLAYGDFVRYEQDNEWRLPRCRHEERTNRLGMDRGPSSFVYPVKKLQGPIPGNLSKYPRGKLPFLCVFETYSRLHIS
jgi:hypothetical protein